MKIFEGGIGGEVRGEDSKDRGGPGGGAKRGSREVGPKDGEDRGGPGGGTNQAQSR